MSWNTTEVALFNAAFTLLGGFVVHRLNLGREKRQAIREFRRMLGELRSRFERQPGAQLLELHHTSVPKVQGDVAALKGDFGWSYSKLRSAADAFASIKRSEIQKPVADGLGTEYETGRKQIIDAIDAIEKAL